MRVQFPLAAPQITSPAPWWFRRCGPTRRTVYVVSDVIDLDNAHGVRAVFSRDEVEELVSLLPACSYRSELVRRLKEIEDLSIVSGIMER